MTATTDDNAAPTIRGEVGATVLGPDNVPIGAQNPGAPDTDAGSLPNLKFPVAAAHNRLLTGGWAREVTVRELPVATTLAGVDMRLKAGAYRELHWHREAEWAFMLAGSARIAAIDPQGRNFMSTTSRRPATSTTPATSSPATCRAHSSTTSRPCSRPAALPSR